MDSRREQAKHCKTAKYGAVRRAGELHAIKKNISKEQKKQRLQKARWQAKDERVPSANCHDAGGTLQAVHHFWRLTGKEAYEDFVKKKWPGRRLMQTKKDRGRLELARRELPYAGKVEAAAKDPNVHLPRGQEWAAKLQQRYDSGRTMCRSWRLVYLLLDAGIPGLFDGCSFRTFLRALFYVGKGTVTRPFKHLEQAKNYLLNRCSSQTSPCADRITNILKNGDGVIVLPVITKVCNDDAECREAAIISLQTDGLTNLLNSSRGVFTGLKQDEQTELGILQLINAFKVFQATHQRRWYLWDIPLKPHQILRWHTRYLADTARPFDSDKAAESITKLVVRLTAVHRDPGHQEQNLRVSSSVQLRQALQRKGEVAGTSLQSTSTHATTGTIVASQGTVFDAAIQPSTLSQKPSDKLRASNDFYCHFFERTVVGVKMQFKCVICGYTIVAEDEPRNRFSLHFRQKHAEILCANRRRPITKKAVAPKIKRAKEAPVSRADRPYYALMKEKSLSKQRSYKYLEAKLRKNSGNEALLLAGVGELEVRRQAMLRAERRLHKFVELVRDHTDQLRDLLRQGLSFNAVLQRLVAGDAGASSVESDDLHDVEEEAEEKGWYIIDYSAFFIKYTAFGGTHYQCRMQRCYFALGAAGQPPNVIAWKFRDHFADKHRPTKSRSQKACTYWQEWPQIKELEREQECSTASEPSSSEPSSSDALLHYECMQQLLQNSASISTAVPLMDALQSGATAEEIIALLEDKLPLRLQQQSRLDKIAALEEQLIGHDLMPVDCRQFFSVNGKSQRRCMFVDCEAAFSGCEEEELHALTKAHCESAHFSM